MKAKIRPRWRSLLLGALLSFVACSLLLAALQPQRQVSMLMPDESWQAQPHPWEFSSPNVERTARIVIRHGLASPGKWRIIPDDNLLAFSINDQRFPLEQVAPGQLRDYRRGFVANLAPILKPGDNVLEFTVSNSEGPGGITLQPEPGPTSIALLCLSLLPLAWGLARFFRVTRRQYLVLSLALLPLVTYWVYTPWTERSHDVAGLGGHLDYIRWIAENLSLPETKDGWTFYHPPLYYILGAPLWKWAAWLGIDSGVAMQAYSLVLWLIFLAASAGTIRLALRSLPWHGMLATLALVLWPSGIMHAIRIGNDVGFYALAALAFYYGLRWWQNHRRSALIAAAICAALLIWTKSNGLVVLASLGILLAWRCIRPHRSFRTALTDMGVFCALAGGAMLLNLSDNIYLYLQGESSNWLISNVVSLDERLRVPVALQYFIPLDLPAFLATAWLDPWNDASGRQNFWNYLLRSALSGEFSFGGKLQTGLSYVWGCLLILLLGRILLVAKWRHLVDGDWLQRNALWLVSVPLWLAGLLVLRIQTPFACSNDFRYILPVLLPFVILSVGSGAFARYLLAGICVSSWVFFLWF